jgi:formate dehydrogenase iron-sulfur subunit
MVAGASTLAPPRNGERRDRHRLPLVQQYLEEQKRLTAVERFSQRHDAEALGPGARFYKDLLPLEKPGKGQQLAFEVDLDACTGCKACVTACHRLNGLDDEEGETWRSVGLLHGGTPAEPVQQTVTTACHHCLDPACMKGCPVGAYEKDPVTGIVKHLDDQCIGCQYCTLTCPYEVPQYSKKRGIVRKCDMCSERVAVGEAPACVQACPNGAIAIKIVDVARVIEDAKGEAFLPGAPSPNITVPTTSYKTKRVLPRNVLPVDYQRVRSSHNHMPLVMLLVLTQLSVGAFIADMVLDQLQTFGATAIGRPYRTAVAVGMGLLALGASVFHLGRPAYAFRAVLGIRTSWMSREALAFGLFAKFAVLYALAFWGEPIAAMVGVTLPPADTLMPLRVTLGWLVAISGAVGIFCSMMLYQVTARKWWGTARTTVRFALTSAVLGLATTSVTLLIAGVVESGVQAARDQVSTLMLPLAIVSTLKLLTDAQIFVHLRERGLGELRRTALLMVGELRQPTALRFGLGALGTVLALALSSGAPTIGTVGMLVFVLTVWGTLLAGELLERVLFFRAVSAPKMPGAVGP